MIRTFKKMKDYIIGNQSLIGQREMMQLSMQTASNMFEIKKLRMDLLSVEKQMSDVDERIFHCGASSKDAGARITSIVEDYGIDKEKILDAAVR